MFNRFYVLTANPREWYADLRVPIAIGISVNSFTVNIRVNSLTKLYKFFHDAFGGVAVP